MLSLSRKYQVSRETIDRWLLLLDERADLIFAHEAVIRRFRCSNYENEFLRGELDLLHIERDQRVLGPPQKPSAG